MELTDRDIDSAKKILAYFWGQSAADWKVNKEVLDVLSEMLTCEGKCSKAMDLVPRPGFRINASYLRRQLAGIARRLAFDGRSYYACKVAVAYKYKERVKIASEGL